MTKSRENSPKALAGYKQHVWQNKESIKYHVSSGPVKVKLAKKMAVFSSYCHDERCKTMCVKV